MSSDPVSPPSSDAIPSTEKSRRYWPPLRTWVLSAGMLTFGILGWYGQVLGNGPLAPIYDHLSMLRDPAVCNILLLIGVFFSIFIPLLWFTLWSAWPAPVRYVPMVTAVAAVAIFFVVFEIQGVSGELIPRLGYRFGAKPDQRLDELAPDSAGQPGENEPTANLASPDPQAFPQFLGPDRNSRLAGPILETDWQSHPPEELWRIPIGAGWSGFAVEHGRMYTMEQRGPNEYVSCYRVQDGKNLWGTPIEARHETVMGYVGPRCTPLLLDGRVYASGATGVLRCLDQLTGEVIWQKDLLEMYGVSAAQESRNIAWGRANSPLAYELPDRKIVIIPAGGADASKPEQMVSLVAFDAVTGEKVWEGGHQQISYASPCVVTVDGEDQILTVNEATISGHNPATGEELWMLDWPGSSSGNATCSQVHDLGGNRFFVSKGYGQGARVFTVKKSDDGQFSPEVVWDNRRVLKTKFTNVAIADGYAFGLNDGILEKVNLDDPKPLWRKRGFGSGQVLMVGEILLVMSEDGELAAVDPKADKFRELGRFKALSSEIAPTWNPLCLYGDLLLIRNAEEAACYRLPTR